MSDVAADIIRVAADGVQVEVDPVGPRLRGLTLDGVPYLADGTASGARLVGAEDGKPAQPLVADGTRWRVRSHNGGTMVFAADTTLACNVVTAVSVGDFGLAVVHGITNTGADPVRVGVVADVHPAAGAAAVLTLCGQAPDLTDLVGADSAEVTGRAVTGPDLDVLIGGGRPLPGKTHVVHRLRAGEDRPGDGVRIWGEAEFEWTRATVGSGSVRLDLRTYPPDAPATDLHAIAPGETRMLSWGMQPFELQGPTS
ncbi:hypothetical protein IU500_24235 [Nocardia terpenica]|uniref:hypothetical protein n=1 Tax=Nocardia terpenica TaxID=455432 RepID=UPI001895DCA9|nr:hypothetical protein [Nocardia terpenica]MBF6063751.1 hypothetical protein [Nocardia terpenica]MBF6107127.1 hypothetical protein [Nocardia terpenica]MBF6114300.1 hypothetical protein [Nocardia terpenica]MBF6121613.1 hypothetical protein [Nocardia terpenica]MBF6154028.1 hypothetical protein [Nocardia terpenica]